MFMSYESKKNLTVYVECDNKFKYKLAFLYAMNFILCYHCLYDASQFINSIYEELRVVYETDGEYVSKTKGREHKHDSTIITT